ncbi:MAG: hypothetical protein NTU53_25530 [Planctomycetota bacterium]|nr:hypothetical protein [Planctomycetota bacterium]
MIRPTLLSLVLLIAAAAGAAEPASKPKIAFFPLGGNAKEELREKSGFSLRAKLDRVDSYEVIDGPKMLEISAEAKEPIGFDTSADAICELGKLVDADVLVWGDINGANEMRIKILDLRDKDPKPRELKKVIKEETDPRFISEEVLETLKGVGKFEHPSEEGVTNDATADALWKKNSNLVKNFDFTSAGSWQAIFEAQKYDVQISDTLPAVDKVNIYRLNEGGKINNVLAMNLSRYCAEGNGMACLSESIKSEPDTRYRISFRYKSDGPTLHVFVKGYTLYDNIKGELAERDVFKGPVPPSGKTGGKWVTVVHDVNPQHVEFPVQTLRVDLYAYLSPGRVMFDDVVLKAVGKQTRQTKDEAIKKPLSRPKGAK